MKPLTLFALSLTALVAGAAITSAQSQAAPNANLFPYDDAMSVARGEEIYVQNCAACHGANLEGQADWRTPNENGRMPAPPHDISGHTWHHPDIQLYQIVKVGIAELVGNGYESDMPGYDGILTDDEILDVMAFIKSTWPSDIIERHNAMNLSVAGQ